MSKKDPIPAPKDETHEPLDDQDEHLDSPQNVPLGPSLIKLQKFVDSFYFGSQCDSLLIVQ